MESPQRALTSSKPPLSSSPSRRGRKDNDLLSSPEFEFEFWNTNCNNPETLSGPFHSADELFSDGFLLPLHFVPSTRSEPECGAEPALEVDHGSEPGPSICSTEPPVLSASKRWMDIFKRSEKKTTVDNNNNVEEVKHEKVVKKRDKDRKNISGPGSAELNINIWPFSRSRSAGNETTRSRKPTSTNRKVSSAPCSRSNSTGESKTLRKSWPSSPGRTGVHLGRASPVWPVKKSGPGTRSNSTVGSESRSNSTVGSGTRSNSTVGPGKGKVLKLNVPVCIGYQKTLSCRRDESGTVVGDGGNGGSVVKIGGGNGNLFGLRGLFTKKSNSAVLTI